MPNILHFVWRLLQQLTKPMWCSVLGIWRYVQFQRWQWAQAKTQNRMKAEEK